jgi:hypothetical protein
MQLRGVCPSQFDSFHVFHFPFLIRPLSGFLVALQQAIDQLFVSSKQIYRKFRNQECRKNGNNNAELFISEIG